ncbi:winged helix-turn-helix domain-containing protein [Parasalinivibrio latis]|uniref:winged helix-turn-helix domain-containing protein n=1 Tax=Parasalinivibrio latis TaxID=2952610 RepID=UPI0030E21ADE
METKSVSRCYRFSLVEFSPEARTLQWENQPSLSLSPNEARVLELLCHHAGEVISLAAIQRVVRRKGETDNDALTILSSLLSKQGDDNSRLPISVVGGYGYRISLPDSTFCVTESEEVPVSPKNLPVVEQESVAPESVPERPSIAMSFRAYAILALSVLVLTTIGLVTM